MKKLSGLILLLPTFVTLTSNAGTDQPEMKNLTDIKARLEEVVNQEIIPAHIKDRLEVVVQEGTKMIPMDKRIEIAKKRMKRLETQLNRSNGHIKPEFKEMIQKAIDRREKRIKVWEKHLKSLKQNNKPIPEVPVLTAEAKARLARKTANIAEVFEARLAEVIPTKETKKMVTKKIADALGISK